MQKSPARPVLPKLDPGEPRDIWQRYFDEHKPKSAEIAEIARLLHQQRLHKHTIACLETALLNSSPEPWMYEVLALAMELDHRPKADVERVLLSRVDFTGTAVQDLLVSAAYLKRLGFDQRALDLYRQASRLMPARPEPYILGLRLARDLKDPIAVEWGAVGVLTNVWQPGYQKHHQEADDIALTVEEALRKAGRQSEADSLKASVAAAHQRDLGVRLTWAGDADLELSVEEPNGGVCSLDNPFTPAGGAFTHDGYGPKAANCFEEYLCASALPGDYLVRVKILSGEVVGRRAELTIRRYAGSEDESVKKMSIPIDGREKVVRLTLNQGRRQALADRPVPHQPEEKRSRSSGYDPREISAGRRAADEYNQNAGGISPPAGGFGFFPVIGVINEGIGFSATAIVTGDRRFVRLALNPTLSGLREFNIFSIPSGR